MTVGDQIRPQPYLIDQIYPCLLVVYNLPIKLCPPSNYVAWQTQLYHLLNYHKYSGLIDGTDTLHAQENSLSDNTKSTPNPSYEIWFPRD